MNNEDECPNSKEAHDDGPKGDGDPFEGWECSLILVIVIGSLAHDVSRLNLRTLYICMCECMETVYAM